MQREKRLDEWFKISDTTDVHRGMNFGHQDLPADISNGADDKLWG